MKATHHRVSVINMVIILLLFVILIGVAFADLIRRKRAEQLSTSIKTLSNYNDNVSALQHNISDLYEAENNFRLYTATYDKLYFHKYHDGLKRIHQSIDSLQKIYEDSTQQITVSESLDDTFKKKFRINEMIAELKHVTDSALFLAVKFDSTKKPEPYIPYYKLPREKFFQTDTTIISKTDGKKSSFFQRVKNLFSDTNEKDTVTINRLSATSIERDSALAMMDDVVNSVEDHYRKHLKIQLAGRNMLNSKEHELVLVNLSLMERLKEMLHGFQLHEQNRQDANKRKALEIAHKSAYQLSFMAIYSFIIIIALLLLILYNIYQVNVYSRRLLAARQEAERQTKVKSNLMASVSHEIRNPLTVIRGFTELLHESNLSGKQHDQLNAVKAASDLLLATVNDILDFSKLEAGRMSIQPAPFQPVKIVEEVHTIMRSMAEQKGLALRMEASELPENLVLQGDAFRLKQVLVNLTSNAIKFTNHGEVIIRAFSAPAPVTAVNASAAAGKKTVLTFEVADTGIGIPPNKIQDVFNEFEQVKQSAGAPSGTGLGLAICRKIVSLHGGTIQAKSELGKGSVFSVKIPFNVVENTTTEKAENTGEVKAPVQVSAPVGRKNLKGKKILLIDDNPLILQLALVMLQKQSAEIITAEDGEHAWNLYQQQDFDMVITDINLPGLNGTALAENIRQLPDSRKANVPVLAITGNVFEQDLDTYAAAGITDYIIKPFAEKDFMEKVEKYLN